jgi:hypothetical protein
LGSEQTHEGCVLFAWLFDPLGAGGHE